jgi:hypothetical protein
MAKMVTRAMSLAAILFAAIYAWRGRRRVAPKQAGRR